MAKAFTGWWICIAVVLLAASCGGEQSSAQDEVTRSRNAHAIILRDSLLERGMTDTIRFGHLYSGEIAHIDFWIENQTTKPVVPLMVKRTCGCTDLEYERQPIAPGEDRRCRMIFDTRGIYGWQLKVIDLKLGGVDRTVRIMVEADVEMR